MEKIFCLQCMVHGVVDKIIKTYTLKRRSLNKQSINNTRQLCNSNEIGCTKKEIKRHVYYKALQKMCVCVNISKDPTQSFLQIPLKTVVYADQ